MKSTSKEKQCQCFDKKEKKKLDLKYNSPLVTVYRLDPNQRKKMMVIMIAVKKTWKKNHPTKKKKKK